jgi:hypothetical protein
MSWVGYESFSTGSFVYNSSFIDWIVISGILVGFSDPAIMWFLSLSYTVSLAHRGNEDIEFPIRCFEKLSIDSLYWNIII